MAARSRMMRLRPRWNPRRLFWRLLPTLPTSWTELSQRFVPASIQIARLTIASVVAYVVANAVFPGILDLTAPLTALLVVQASTVGTLRMGLVRVGAVLTGVLVAVVATAYIGLSWWSLAGVIAASLIIANLLRLGDQTLEAPISGMLILAVSAPGVAAEVRVANTLIGTVVGIAFSLLAPIAIPNARASEAVRRVTRSQASLLNEIAATLGNRPPHPDEVAAWTEWTDDVARELRAADAMVDAVRETRALNPRALTTPTVHHGLTAAVRRLERALLAERALVAAIGRQVPTSDPHGEESSEAELHRAFAVILDDVARGLRSFGDLIESEYGGVRPDLADVSLERTLEIVLEAKAVLTELTLLDVGPRGQKGLWLLHGSVLAAVEQILAEIDVEHAERRIDAALGRRVDPSIRPGVFLRRVREGS